MTASSNIKPANRTLLLPHRQHGQKTNGPVFVIPDRYGYQIMAGSKWKMDVQVVVTNLFSFV